MYLQAHDVAWAFPFDIDVAARERAVHVVKDLEGDVQVHPSEEIVIARSRKFATAYLALVLPNTLIDGGVRPVIQHAIDVDLYRAWRWVLTISIVLDTRDILANVLCPVHDAPDGSCNEQVISVAHLGAGLDRASVVGAGRSSLGPGMVQALQRRAAQAG
ncbi:MAG: hypothetical protein PHI12_15080, partial [Dehalococcoidales bacterium]|nr:hypothetical protein [Dehalococcoidales bacterium]